MNRWLSESLREAGHAFLSSPFSSRLTMADNEAPQDVKENVPGDAVKPDIPSEEEDWDKTRNDAPAADAGAEGEGDDAKFESFGRSNGRGLAQLMSPHALKGQDIMLTAEEEKALATELGNWVVVSPNTHG